MLTQKGEKVNMENAVIYARYSSHNQTENSIEAQVSAAKDFASKHNLNIIHIYADRAKTGTNDNREEFQQMLKDSNQKKFQVVIIWKVDRFGRNREEITINKYHLKKNGVRLEYVAENIIEGPEGVILESVLEGFAEYYSKQLSVNIKRGLKEKASKGYITGGMAPLGYTYQNHQYFIDETEAKKIKEVFKMFISGLPYTEISAKTGIAKTSIRYIVRNRTYTGEYNKCDTSITIPAIISDEEFKLASKRVEAAPKISKKHSYLLSGKIFCTCGSKYNANVFNNYRYYGSKCCCNAKVLHMDKIDKEIMETITEILSDDKLVDRVYEKLKLKIKNSNSNEKHIKQLQKKKANIIKAVENGMDYSLVKDRITELETEINSLNVDLNFSITREDVARRLKSIKALDTNKALIENIIDKIIVNPVTGLYEIKFGL